MYFLLVVMMMMMALLRRDRLPGPPAEEPEGEEETREAGNLPLRRGYLPLHWPILIARGPRAAPGTAGAHHLILLTRGSGPHIPRC